MIRLPTTMHRFAWRALAWTIAIAAGVAFYLGQVR